MPAVPSPTDASVADFCRAFAGTNGPSSDDNVRAAKAAVEELRSTGTPPGVSGEVRQGFLLEIAIIEAIPDEASTEVFDQAGKDLSAADSALIVAFLTYAATTCPSAGTGT